MARIFDHAAQLVVSSSGTATYRAAGWRRCPRYAPIIAASWCWQTICASEVDQWPAI
jgi:hypothetical protein